MSYRINRTDGELLVDLTDGIIDNTTTNLTLIGKNYQGFGELVNENFVKLLENFASTTQPTNPMTGQLWYDKQDQRLKIFNGTVFRSASGTIIQSSQPSNLTKGDLWVDNAKNRLYIYDGADLILVGPNYDGDQGKTTFEAASQVDTSNIQRQIFLIFVFLPIHPLRPFLLHVYLKYASVILGTGYPINQSRLLRLLLSSLVTLNSI